MVATWEEHLRQQEERRTVRDDQLVQRALELAQDREPRVQHLLSAYRAGASEPVREPPPATAQTSTTTGRTIGRLRRRS